MKTKKLFGFLFMSVAIFSMLIIVLMSPKIATTIFMAVTILTGTLDSYQIGRITGSVLYWTAHISLTVALWVYGRRWIKNAPDDEISEQ